MTPAIASAGDTLTLEGTFAESAMARFPGGVAQAVTVVGEHRGTVVVPEAATAGELVVTTGGATIGPLEFRRTSFALGLQPFRASYEQTDGARQSPTLRIARTAAVSALIKSWLYIVGGVDGSGALNTVERASMNADGTIDSFEVVGDVTLVQARADHTGVVIGSSLYLFGGSGADGALASVERAPIRTDGSLGTFTSMPGVALSTARSGHTSIVLGNHVYVIGGTASNGTKLASIERAEILPDGSLGPFGMIAAALAAARSGHTTELLGDALYVIGGDPSGAPSGSVERATVAADGSPGMFTAAPGIALVTPRSGHRSVVLGGAVYVLGGSTAGGPARDVERAPISAGGSLGPFAAISSTTLASARSGHTLATVADTMYAIGGRGTAGPVRSVEHASVNADSAIGSFAESNVALVLARAHHTSTVIRDFIYVIGRSVDQNTLERGSILGDGSMTRFVTVAGISLITNRSSHTVARIGKYLYVIGGSGAESSIERAVVNSDGSLSPFSSVPVTLVEPRSGHVSVVIGNFLYIISGFGSVNHVRLTSIERASINDDGSLNAFATVSGVALNVGRNYFAVIATDQFLYIVGGLDDAGGTVSVERSAISVDGSVGPFSVVPSLREARGTHRITVIGNSVYVIGGLTPGGLVHSIERAGISIDGSLSEFGIVSTLSTLRARHSAAVLGNSLYLIGVVTELANGNTMDSLNIARADLR